jgi:Virulence factor BrkB
MFQLLSQALPAAASDLIQKTMNEVTSASGIGKLSFGLIVSLWCASAGMLAIMGTLNAEHGVTEDRSLLRQRVTAVALTLGWRPARFCSGNRTLRRKPEPAGWDFLDCVENFSLAAGCGLCAARSGANLLFCP